MVGRLSELLQNGKPDEEPKQKPQDDDSIELGECASIRRAKPLTCLRVELPDRWEFLPYYHMVLNCVYEPHGRIAFEFSDGDHRKRLVVEGRNLKELVLAISEHRTEWIRPAVRDTAVDGQFIVLKAEVVVLEPRR